VIFMLALLFATGCVLTGELTIPIGLHISWNFCEANVFGFPLNGSISTTGAFIATRQDGPADWTGGAYGPEAGLLAVAAAIVGVLSILGWVRVARGSLHLAALPAKAAGLHVDAEGRPDLSMDCAPTTVSGPRPGERH
jgi:hypothetical protein